MEKDKTPKQKAKELVDKFKDLVLIDYRYDEEPFFDYQKDCALICAKRERGILMNLASRVIFGTAAAKVLEYQIEQNLLLIKEIKKL